MSDKSAPQGPSTRAVHAGEGTDPATGAASMPIYQTAPFGFSSAQELEDAFLDQKEGRYIYSRMGNPTVRALERKVAALEEAEDALAFGSGMAAISTAMFTLLKPGSRMVAYRDIYGGTAGFFSRVLEPWGVDLAWAEVGDESDSGGSRLEDLLAGACDVLYLESPTNPTLKVADLARAAELGRQAGATVVVDNTFATPVLQHPLALGAHLVVHSLTKFLGGHGDTTGGLVAGDAGTIARIRTHRVDIGGIMDPLAAFLVMRGVKTVKVRVDETCRNAQAVAEHLQAHPLVKKVNYPGLPSDPYHETASRQMAAFGGMLSFEVDAPIEEVRRIVDAFRMIRIIPSLGSVETTLLLPAVSSHYKLSRQERESIGIPDGLIRLSIGIEDEHDIIADLDLGLSTLGG